jgi:uncharacterized membrane protein
MWIVIVVVALLVIFALGKRSMERQNRPNSRDEIERERDA